MCFLSCGDFYQTDVLGGPDPRVKPPQSLFYPIKLFFLALKPGSFLLLDPGPPPAQPEAGPPVPVGPPVPPSGRVADN